VDLPAVAIASEPTRRRARAAAPDAVGVLFEVAAVLGVAADVERAGSMVLGAVANGFGWESATLWLVDEKRQLLAPRARWDVPRLRESEFRSFTDSATFAHGEGVPGEVWASGQPLSIRNFGATGFRRAALARRAGLSSVFAFPVAAGEAVLGVIEFFGATPAGADEAVVGAMRAIGAQFGQYLRHVEIERLAQRNEKLARQVLDSSLDAIVTIDRDGLITGWNRQAEQTFGWPVATSRVSAAACRSR
jgi:PAS domain-containing protein